MTSKPGTGKTIVASVAALNHVNTGQSHPQVLYLCTTHESAVQTVESLKQMAIKSDIRIGTALKDSCGKYLIELLNLFRGRLINENLFDYSQTR